jgi:hypothetical protein
MRIEIEDSTIEDLVREALDGVDIVGQVDVEELVLNEIQELNLLEGIDVKGLVRSAIKDAVEDSDDFNAFMKMRDVVESLELQLGALSTKYNSLLKIVESQGDEITFMRTVLLDVERKQSNPWYKFWN